jgi:N-acyl-D-amino-acid deacylase
MKTVLALLVALSLALLGCQQSSQVPAIGEYVPGVASYDRAFVRIMNKWEIPGGALTVMEKGEVLLARGYGLADVARHEPALPESLFRIASLSKPITAVAVLKLVEENKLSLDAAAFRLLDDIDLPAGATVDPRIHDITIRHLLEHSGGWDESSSFDPMFSSQRTAHGVDLPAAADCATIIRYMLGRSLDFDPGSRYTYSNFGYCVLGRVIERASGQTYQEYVKSQILAPIGIDRMALGRSRLADRHPAEVRYYERGETSPTQSVFADDSGQVPWPYGGFCLEAMDAHGGWIGSATDLARFVSALDGAHASRILQAETVDTMLARPAAPLWEGKSDYYALGWRVRPARRGAAWWHTGSIPGSTAVLYHTPSGRVWAALFNARPDDAGGEFLVDLIGAMGRAALVSRIPWHYWPVLALSVGAGLAAAWIARTRKRRVDNAQDQVVEYGLPASQAAHPRRTTQRPARRGTRG